jgi:putative transposase
MYKVIKTYQIRLNPTTEQIVQLNELSVVKNLLYNKIIQEQIKEHETNNKIHSEFDLNKLITIWRNEENSEFKKLNSKACQTISKQVFGSYRSFFNLIKKDKSARPPKLIENINEYKTLVYNQSGWSFKTKLNKHILINGILIKYSDGNRFPNLNELNIKEIKIKKILDKWLMDFSVEYSIEHDDVITVKNKILALDLGLKTLATGIDTDGNLIMINNKTYKTNNYFNKQINKVKSKLSKKIKYSKSYNKLNKIKTKLYNKKNAQIKQTLHIQSKNISDMNYKTIVIGDLTVKKLMSTEGINSGYKGKGKRKSFNDSNISMFISLLSYKCQSKNTEIIKISEAYTTQTNCLTGHLFEKHVDIKDREVSLNKSITIDRDLNAAINIYKRYEKNHLALVNEPLNVFNVVNKYNLLTKSSV